MNKEEVEKLSEIIRTVSYSKGIGQLEIELLGFCNRLLDQAEEEKKTLAIDVIRKIDEAEHEENNGDGTCTFTYQVDLIVLLVDELAEKYIK